MLRSSICRTGAAPEARYILLTGQWTTVAPLAARKGIELRLQITDGVARFASDPEKLKQVLINLLANAVKFTDEGEVVCTVRCDPRRLEVEVRDTGIGIAPEDRARIFKRALGADEIAALARRQPGALGRDPDLVLDHAFEVRKDGEPGSSAAAERATG